MNPFKALENIQKDYEMYVSSFQKFKNPSIRDWVTDRVQEGTLLWKDPHIVLNRPFEKGDSLQELVGEELLHEKTLKIFTVKPGDESSEPVELYRHQSDAIRSITQEEKNTIISTGTGSGKSFCFGIPIISTCLKMKDKGHKGVKAIIVYPMNALANSQYDDFSQRLHESGLKIALYTGDTETSPDEALKRYRDTTGREMPYDCEVISREEIQANPPDILMTNYVMLDLIFSRWEDRKLFPKNKKGVLQFLVLDEVHTYTGQRGADVACLIRRLKQHTKTKGDLRCIGTSATVQAGEGEDGKEIVSKFAQDLFGEPFDKNSVITESYEESEVGSSVLLSTEPRITEDLLEKFEPTLESAARLVEVLSEEKIENPKPEILSDTITKLKAYEFVRENLSTSSSIDSLADKYKNEVRTDASQADCIREIKATLLAGTVAKTGDGETATPLLVPKLHTFFSQGRTISSCLSNRGPHLNDRGETECPKCSLETKERITFPLNFCRACGQEYYGATLKEEGELIPRDIDTEEEEGESIYLYSGIHNQDDQPFPEDWYTDGDKLKERVQNSVPQEAEYCPECNKINPKDSECFGHQRMKVSIIPKPFLFCPSCGVYYDARIREFNKLFTFGSVGRSTATDMLVSSTLTQLPEEERKIIAFSDNRQDTALQASHMNNLQKKVHFRRGLYQALLRNRTMGITEVGSKIFDVFESEDVMPMYSSLDSDYISDATHEKAYRDYLRYNVLQDLRSTQHKNQQNLEDVGLMKVSYQGLDKLSEADQLWEIIPEIEALSPLERYDLLLGFLDIFRKQQAISHPSINNYPNFKNETIDNLNEECLFHLSRYALSSVGYSDDADTKSRGARVLRISTARSKLVLWIKKVLGTDMERSKEIALELVELFSNKEKRIGYLTSHHVRRCGNIYLVRSEAIQLQIGEDNINKTCKKCSTIAHFKQLNLCTNPGCAELEDKDFTHNYFYNTYSKNFNEAIKVEVEEHSGQIDGHARKDIENRFKDPDSPLNTIVCTPTMELGIDIGALSAVYMRNVPPSPSNYAQRSGRAGRKSQPALISTFCGVGNRRGPHDQYFYKYPDKIISGMITPPRFLLDNKVLIRTHMHSLILEGTDLKLPSSPQEILDIESEGYPMFPSLKKELKRKLESSKSRIISSGKAAFESEMEKYDWFDDDYLRNVIESFIDKLDDAFNYWRIEYENLSKEQNLIHLKSKKKRLKPSDKFRYHAIQDKLASMREGDKEFNTYGYLRNQGFLPGYGFPTSYVTLSLSDKEDEILRDTFIAINEFAPSNTLYYRGTKYQVTRARPKTKEHKLDLQPVMICPECENITIGEKAKTISACPDCGLSFEEEHPNLNAIEFPDMYASKRQRITSDEEERLRLGYDIVLYYQTGEPLEIYQVKSGGNAFDMSYEHNGSIIKVNRGVRKTDQDIEDSGFTLCSACYQWLSGKNVDKHVDEERCPRNATEEDIVSGLYLYKEGRHDVVTLDIPLPEDIQAGEEESFYRSIKEAILQGIQISLNVEESEVSALVAEDREEPGRFKIAIYEKAEGGIGVVKALTDPNRFKDILNQAKIILHEGEEKACAKACYECLLSYYNQQEHVHMNRNLALTFLRDFDKPDIQRVYSEDRLEQLMESCDSDFEKDVLMKIVKLGLPLPDESQKTLYDKEVPVVKPDFFYNPNVAIFVDGAPHRMEHISRADETKREKLKALGYTVVSIRSLEDVDSLRQYLVR